MWRRLSSTRRLLLLSEKSQSCCFCRRSRVTQCEQQRCPATVLTKRLRHTHRPSRPPSLSTSPSSAVELQKQLPLWRGHSLRLLAFGGTLLALHNLQAQGSVAHAQTLFRQGGGALIPNQQHALPGGASGGGGATIATEYLIVGTSIAAIAALRRIRQLDPHAQCTVLVEHPSSLMGVDLRQLDGATLVVGRQIARLDTNAKVVELCPPPESSRSHQRGAPSSIRFTTCLLAQGGRLLPPQGVMNFGPGCQTTGGGSYVVDCSRRPGADRQARAKLVERVRLGELRHVTVMGGGWLGVELACALRQANRAATVVLACQEAAPLGRFLPKFLRAELKARLSKSGVVVRGYSQLAFVYEPASARVRSSETANDDSDLRAVETRIAALHAKETAAEAHAFCRGDEVELHGLVNNDLFNGRRGRIVECSGTDEVSHGRPTFVVDLGGGEVFDLFSENLRKIGHGHSPTPISQRSSALPVEAAAQMESIVPGAIVTLLGLHRRADLNGCVGTVVSPGTTPSTYQVRLHGDDRKITVRESNLQLSLGNSDMPLQDTATHPHNIHITLLSVYDRQSATSFASDALALAISHTESAVEVSPMSSSLEIDARNGGIVCNSDLCAGSGIFAAGDDLSYFDKHLGRRRERGDEHAVATAHVAANNMVEFVLARKRGNFSGHEAKRAPAHAPVNMATCSYDETPVETHAIQGTIFYCIGDCDASLDTYSFWETNTAGVAKSASWLTRPSQRGVVAYLDGNELVGALAWMPVDEHEMATTSRDNTISTFRHAVLSARKAMRQLDFDVLNDSAKSSLTHRTYHDASMLQNHLQHCATQVLYTEQQAEPMLESQRLQFRRDSSAKLERSLQQRRRRSFRSPEQYLTTRRVNAVVDVGRVGTGGSGANGVENGTGWPLDDAAARIDAEVHPAWN